MPLDDMPRRHYAPRHYAPVTLCPGGHYAPDDTMPWWTLCPGDTTPRVTLCPETLCPGDTMPRWTTCPSGHYAPVDTMPRETLILVSHQLTKSDEQMFMKLYVSADKTCLHINFCKDPLIQWLAGSIDISSYMQVLRTLQS